MNSIRVVLAVCVTDGYEMEQLDADSAYQNCELSDRVYMDIPPGVKTTGDPVTGHDRQLAPGIERFMEASFRMALRIVAWIKIRKVKDALKSAFKIKELGDAKLILGMGINHDKRVGTLMIKQTSCIDDVTQRFGQDDQDPCALNLKLSREQSPGSDAEATEMQTNPYRFLIGCLMYIATCIRLGIAYVVTQPPRFLENTGIQHWRAAICVLMYLSSTHPHEIAYKGGASNVMVEAFADADGGSNIDDRRSVSGVMVNMSNGRRCKVEILKNCGTEFSTSRVYGTKPVYPGVLWTYAMLKDMEKGHHHATQV
ncbi:FOG: Transposon-encoded proteins with TYA, reverse transcriptase, integrase domains in various combinations [Plasmopara halstedii]|uniref:FOG: Transposon-encoded proteins with TYA, reverse transcriptase, integrase domains in various combinations n=1 Tax=Plasmopara halstedii TaxID=4781 RepID=A0A0P1AVW9_PLAHL|nr:FOG: Transposon-encoded proteins with TYA, reverse transcriptase, integrase domains in various combinations [Plasmopara halstedii]CEG44840.1 FOG: Transposon-encoded proteins with TYA, reverse transcriptase, integrase domains in various combinations [Plasmopara halstedii]|eukprot:XP_024581209.1 FOG: Transposon-encoded proteins with TYA, reverse transcriptase, integrase domains in various combinations [Plasmopara halstedii]